MPNVYVAFLSLIERPVGEYDPLGVCPSMVSFGQQPRSCVPATRVIAVLMAQGRLTTGRGCECRYGELGEVNHLAGIKGTAFARHKTSLQKVIVCLVAISRVLDGILNEKRKKHFILQCI